MRKDMDRKRKRGYRRKSEERKVKEKEKTDIQQIGYE